MIKNAFCFIFKALFGLKIFKFLFCLVFWSDACNFIKLETLAQVFSWKHSFHRTPLGDCFWKLSASKYVFRKSEATAIHKNYETNLYIRQFFFPLTSMLLYTAQKMKFSINYLFRKCSCPFYSVDLAKFTVEILNEKLYFFVQW